MIIFGVNAAQIASQVWTAVTRTVTSIAASMTAVGAVNTSVAAGVILDLRPAAGKFRMVSLNDGNHGSMDNGFYDGTTFDDSNAITAFRVGMNNANVGVVIKNVSAGALTASWSGIEVS